eukprot:148109_1
MLTRIAAIFIKSIERTFVDFGSENLYATMTFGQTIESENFIDVSGARTLHKLLTEMAYLKFQKFQRIWRRVYVGPPLSGLSKIYINPSQSWRAVDRQTEETFAMKVEDRLCPKAQLATEFKVYQALNEAHVSGYPMYRNEYPGRKSRQLVQCLWSTFPEQKLAMIWNPVFGSV